MKFVIGICLLFFVGCIPPQSIFSSYNSKGFAITQLKGSNVRLYVTPVVDVLEFQNSFRSEYGSRSKFDSLLTSRVKDILTKVATTSIDSSNETEKIFLDKSLPEEKVENAKEVFESANENYFIGIKEIVISNSIKTNPINISPSTTISTPGGNVTVGGMPSGGGTSESCVVSVQVEVWSVKERKRLTEFTAVGQSGVTFFAYGTALKNAVNEAILSLSNYIVENKK